MAPIWSALPWRMTLIIKSVPMFPDPMIATFNCCIYLSFQRVVVPAARSCCSAEANADGADIGDFGFVLLILLPSDHRPQCSGQYDIARSKRLTGAGQLPDQPEGDRKSTRLNSSHQIISYAVFCLKKKKKNNERNHQTPRYPHFCSRRSAS